jgi:hypothetical protein
MGEGPGYTWTTENAIVRERVDRFIRQQGIERRIDYVFIVWSEADPDGHCTVEAVDLAFNRPIDGTRVSDHFGVVVGVDMGKN